MLAAPLAAGLVPALLMLYPCNRMADANQEVGLGAKCWIFALLCSCSMLALQNVCLDLCAVKSVLFDYSANCCDCIITLCVVEIAAALRNVCYVVCYDNMLCSHAASIGLPGNNYIVQVARRLSMQQENMCDLLHQSVSVAGAACVPGSVLYVVSLVKYEHRLIKRDVHSAPDDWVYKIAVWAEHKICLTCTAPDP